MSTLSREEVRGLLPAYVLGALEVDERLALEAGLARYPELRAELAQYSAVTHGLNATVPLRRPPPSLKAGLMAQAAPRPDAKPSWWQRFIDALSDSSLAPKLAAAALVLSAAFVVIQAAMRIPLAAQQISAQQQASAIVANSIESVHLGGTQNAPKGAWATVHYTPSATVAAMRVGSLPPAPESQAYQLWLVDGTGKRWSGAVFNTAETGNALVLVNCPVPMQNIVRFGVSVEPAGGSPAPTGPGMLRSTQS